MWKKECTEIRNVVKERASLEATLGANFPNTDIDKIENKIKDIDDFIESRIIELRVFSEKRSRQRFSNKLPK